MRESQISEPPNAGAPKSRGPKCGSPASLMHRVYELRPWHCQDASAKEGAERGATVYGATIWGVRNYPRGPLNG